MSNVSAPYEFKVMESRARTILPIIAIILVILIAITAFFVTRRIRNTARIANNPTASAVSSNNLLVPSTVPNANISASARPTVGAVTRQPVTGPEDDVKNTYTTTIDDAGFRESTIKVPVNTNVVWLNLGTKPQEISLNGIASPQIQPNQSFSHVITAKGTLHVMIGSAKQSIIAD